MLIRLDVHNYVSKTLQKQISTISISNLPYIKQVYRKKPLNTDQSAIH